MSTQATQKISKVFTALLVVILALALLPASVSLAAGSGPNFPTTGSDVAGVGSVTWSNPGNIVSNNNSNASAYIGTEDITHYLGGTNHGFAIPLNATINGIQVTIGRYANVIPSARVRDNEVRLVKAGVVVTGANTNRADTGSYWPSSEEAITYGSPSDLWGTTWTPAEINAANFGVVLSAINTSQYTPRTAYVDYMNITVTYTVLPLQVTAVNNTYGNTVNLSANLTPAASGKSISFTLNGVAACNGLTNASGVATCSTTLTTDVGTYPSGVGASFAGGGTYAASSGTASLTVNPADLLITASDDTMVYGGTVPAITPSYTGLQAGDLAPATPPTCSTLATSTSDVGPYASSCSGAVDGNYTVTYAAGSVDVTPADLLITASDDTMVYGGTVPTITPGYSGLQAGDTEPATPPTCSTAANGTSDVGPYASSCSGALDGNYTITYAAGSVDVTPADLLITASGGTMVYGGTVPTITPSYTGMQAGETEPATPPTCSTAATGTSDVGPYTSSCSGAVDANYTITYAAGSVDVTPADLLITASDDTMVYGGTVPAITPSYTGLQAGDLEPATSPTCSTLATGTSDVGPYASSCSGAVDANYTISYAPGSVSVTKAAQAIIFDQPASPAAYHASFNVNPTADTGLPVTLVASGGCSNTAFAVTMTSSTLACTLTASQPGNGNYNAAADVVRTVEAKKADQAITFAQPASPQAYHSQFNVSLTADSGLAVSVTASGACIYNAGVVTMTASSGDCTLKASQAGDENYNPAADVTHVVAAMKASQAITFDQPASPVAPGTVVTVTPTSDSGLAVTLVAEGACVSNGFEVTAASTSGTCTLTAKQAGDENYNPATDVVRTVDVVEAVDRMNKVYLPAIQKQ